MREEVRLAFETMPNSTPTHHNSTVWIDPWPLAPYVCPPPPVIQWYPVSKSIEDFTDEELVAELILRKRGKNALDRISIKED
jgi:hypothetical protein